MRLDSIPQGILVFLTIAGFTLFLFLSQPPRTICDTQKESFMKSQKGLLYPGVYKKTRRASRVQTELKQCREGSSPGACYPLFLSYRTILRDLDNFSTECSAAVSELDQLQNMMKNGIELFALIGWGDTPPAKGTRGLSWLKASELYLFCQMQEKYQHIYGEEAWNQLRESIMANLPGEAPIINANGECANCENRKLASKVLDRNELWYRSIFSVSCQVYR